MGRPEALKGLTKEDVRCTDDDPPFDYVSWVFPELGCARRILDNSTPPVLEMFGRRWLVCKDLSDDSDSIPTGGVITFVETEEPESPWEPHDLKKETKTYWFGQPTFIQNPVFPHYEGQIAYPLLTIESGWGDCGNENILVAFDEEGIPVGLFHEFSCC